MRKRQETLRNYDSVRRTTCCNCPTGCGMKVFLKDNAVADIFGDEEHPINKGSLCPKGLLAYWHLRNPERILYPQIRERLDQPFRRTTREAAISFTSKRLKEVAASYGKNSLFVYGDESAPFEYFAGENLFARHFGSQNGPYCFMPHPFGHEGGIKRMFGVPASQLLMNSPRDWCNSRCIVLYRSDLAASDPITFGHIIDARDRGTTLLVIDAKHTITSSKATLSLRVRPGSEHAVLKGIINLLMMKGLIDETFLDEVVPDHSSLMSKVEDFTPEKVAQCARIKGTDLEKMADMIGRSKPLQVITADWNTRHYLSDEELFLCGALVCLRGSVGIPGGGLNLMAVSPFPAENPPFSLSLDNILLGHPKVGTLIWYGNPCARMAHGKATKKALGEVPLIVHLSSYPNETFHYSHVSFPMSSWLEYSGLVTNNNGRAIQWHHKVAEPPGECRSPLEFWNDLAQACGVSEDIPFHLEQGFADAAGAADLFLKQNQLTRSISVEKLDPEKNPPGGLLWPCVSESDLEFEESRFIRGDVRGRNILFQRGQLYPLSDKRFPTLTGKITFLTRIAGDVMDTDYGSSGEGDPCLRPPFPMVLVTGLLADFVEEYGYFVSDRDRRTARLVVKVHPQIGKFLGVNSGQNVIIENERGNITAPVWLSEDVGPGVVWCPEGLDPYQPYFYCESPRALFEKPGFDQKAGSFTPVTIYKPGQDRMKVAKELSKFLCEMNSRMEGSVRR